MLSMRISSLRACSACFEGTFFKFVIFTEGVKNSRLKNGKTDAYAEHTRQFLMRMLSMRTSSLRTCSACASVPDAYAQHTHKGRSIRARKYNFLISLISTYEMKNFKKLLLTLTNSLKTSTEEKKCWP
jgi:hypothetical protein